MTTNEVYCTATYDVRMVPFGIAQKYFIEMGSPYCKAYIDTLEKVYRPVDDVVFFISDVIERELTK